MKTFIVRIKSWVDNKIYVIRLNDNNRYKAMATASDIFVAEHHDKLPASFL
jgi:hypothetical protein